MSNSKSRKRKIPLNPEQANVLGNVLTDSQLSCPQLRLRELEHGYQREADGYVYTFDKSHRGWHVQSKGLALNQTAFAPIQAKLEGYPVLSMANCVWGGVLRGGTFEGVITPVGEEGQGCFEYVLIPSTVKDLTGAFVECTIQRLPDAFGIPSSVEFMSGMFFGCRYLRKLPNSFKIPPKVTDLSNLFDGCESLTVLPKFFRIPNTVISVTRMFARSGLVNLPKEFLLHDNVVYAEQMFHGCTQLQNIYDFSVSPKTSCYSMFGKCRPRYQEKLNVPVRKPQQAA